MEMESDSPQVHESAIPLIMKNGLLLHPVGVASEGAGLPYAPQNWPKTGDMWVWKSGSRIANSGYFHDRYLYPPRRLIVEHGAARMFKTKLSVRRFIDSQFPGADVDAFFSSFSWQIASHKLYHKTDLGSANVVEKQTSHECKLGAANLNEVFISSRVEAGEHSNVGYCKARNETCKSLVGEGRVSSELLPCNICCTELGFCRLCCCILCCQSISLDSRRFEYIRCNAKIDGDFICGHMAHLECAIRASMAGSLEGNNRLDAEYYCLRCESRTDLVFHVMKLLHSSTKNLQANAEEVLRVCVRMLDGSKRKIALQMLQHIQFIIETKLKGGSKLNGVCGKEDTLLVDMGVTSANVKSAPISMIQEEQPSTNIESTTQLGSEFDHWLESSKLKDDFDEVRSYLRKSREDNYKLAEDMLWGQANCIRIMYGAMKTGDGEMEDQIKQELLKLERMKEIGKDLDQLVNKTFKNIFVCEKMTWMGGRIRDEFGDLFTRH